MVKVAGGGDGYDLTGGDPIGCSTPKLPVVNGGGASLPASVEGCFGGGPAGRPPCIDGDASDVTAPMLALCSPDEAEPVPRLPVAFPAVPTWTGAVWPGFWFSHRWSAVSILMRFWILTSFAFGSELKTKSAT